MRWLGAFVGLVLGVSSAEAQPRYELGWNAEAGADACPGEGAIAAEIAVRLGRNPFTHGAEQELEVTLGGGAGAWTASLRVHRADGTVMWSRPLQSQDESCYTLADAIVLSVVLMIDPSAAPSSSREPIAEPAAEPVVEAALEEAEEPAEERAEPGPLPEPSSPSPNPRALATSAGAVVTSGVLPRAAAGVRLGVSGVVYGRLRWGAGMRFYPEVNTGDDNFAFGLTSVSVSLCADVLLAERVLIGGCASPHLGVIHGVVFNPEPTFPGDRVWVGLGVRGSASIRIVGPLWLGIETGGMFSLLRQTFTIREEATPVFSQDVLGVDAGLVLSLRFI